MLGAIVKMSSTCVVEVTGIWITGLPRLIVVVVTSIYRIPIGRKLWKALHYLVYPAAALLFVHGILTNQNLDNKAVDYLDGEKIYIETCLFVVVAASVWAWQFRAKKQKREQILHVGRFSHAEGD